MTELFSSASSMWLLFGTVLIFFMQAGFAMLECGFGRSKNAGNIVMKNLLDFSYRHLRVLAFGLWYHVWKRKWLFRVAGSLPAVWITLHILPAGIPFSAFFIFQTVFCATSATIVSGAMAERTKFESYCILCAVIALIAYPVTGHWIWGGGWLSSLGFQDFAGSSAVHLAGGTAALIGALVLGPRIGKYDSKGNSKAMPGHNLPLAALGIFILWMGWFGFCGASTKSMEGTQIRDGCFHFCQRKSLRCLFHLHGNADYKGKIRKVRYFHDNQWCSCWSCYQHRLLCLYRTCWRSLNRHPCGSTPCSLSGAGRQKAAYRRPGWRRFRSWCHGFCGNSPDRTSFSGYGIILRRRLPTAWNPAFGCCQRHRLDRTCYFPYTPSFKEHFGHPGLPQRRKLQVWIWQPTDLSVLILILQYPP